MLEQLAQILHQRKAQEMPQISDPSMAEAPPMQMPPMAPPQMPMPRPQRPDPMTTVEQDRINMLEGQRDQMGQPRQEGLLMQLLRGASEGIVHGDRLPQVRMQQEQLKRQKMLDLANEAERVRSGVRQRGQDQLQVEQGQRLQAQDDRDAAMLPAQTRLLEAQARKAEAPPEAVQPREIDVFTNNEGKRVVIRQMPDGTLKAEPQGEVQKEAGPQQIPGRDVPFSPEVLAQKKELEGPQGSTAKPDYEWILRGGQPLQIQKGTAQAGDRPYDVASGRTNAEGISPYSKERTTRALADIEDARKSVSGWTTGMGAEALAKLGGTDARKLQGKLNTLKASIMQNELAQMRQSSKTGGALGQVSDREGKLLESSLAALDQGLEGQDLIEELDKAKGSIERWTREMEKASGSQPAPAAGGGASRVIRFDAQGNRIP